MKTDIITIEGVDLINTTPHAINLLSETTGKEYIVMPCGYVLSASTVEITESQSPTVAFVKTVFERHDEGIDFVESIPFNTIIIASMISMKAYGGQVVAMTPSKGFERVPPAEKKMNLHKYCVD